MSARKGVRSNSTQISLEQWSLTSELPSVFDLILPELTIFRSGRSGHDLDEVTEAGVQLGEGGDSEKKGVYIPYASLKCLCYKNVAFNKVILF